MVEKIPDFWLLCKDVEEFESIDHIMYHRPNRWVYIEIVR